MAALTIPKPGTHKGPCRGWCRHPVCKDLKGRARSKCLYCLNKVGYGVGVYTHGDDTVHADCHEEAVAANTALFTLP